MPITRIRNGAVAHGLPQCREILIRGLGTAPLVRDPEAALSELTNKVHLDNIGLFIVHARTTIYGWILMEQSRSAFNPACSVIHIYNEGGRDTLTELVEAGVDYARAGDYDRIVGMWDEAHAKAMGRLFAGVGDVEVSGRLAIIDITDSLL